MDYQKTTNLGGPLDKAFAKSLPVLPGYSFNLNVGQDRFHRPAHWGLSKSIPVLNDRDDPRPKPGIGGRDPPPWAPCRAGPDHSIYPRGYGSNVPSWIAFNKQVLVFEAYYQEPIPETALENYRVHRCKVYFFLEDDTVQVIEPKVLNSGVPQGQIIRRHRVPLPSPCEDLFYTLEHFNVGCEVNLYGKVFYICGCDGFTRKFLNRLGISVPQNMEMPLDPGSEKIKDRQSSQFARKPHHAVDTRGPFLQHGGHVLRFWSYWDDRCKLYGDLRYFVIHYFLSDDTMEVREILRPNSGYEAYPLFVRRGKVPKNCDKLVQLPGQVTPLTVLNVFGSMYASRDKKAHYMVDNLANQDSGIEFFKDDDLAIGAVLNIFGRAFIITDCDEFTKQYYREKYNVQDFTPLTLDEPKKRFPKPVPPPYNGWGTEEDSLQSWKSLELKPHIKDYRRFADKEKDILRFDAKLYNALQRVNQSRRFIIQYFMSDDTMQVSERDHPNSGLPRGKFLVRMRIEKPGRQIELGEEATFYGYEDLFIGNVLNINEFQFQLATADEFTLSYMEGNKHLFPHANVCVCLDKLREAMGPLQAEDVLKCFSEHDTCLQGVLDIRSFRTLILQITKCGLSEHEILTLGRAYAAKTPPPGTDFQTLQAIAQTELRKANFDKTLLARIEYTLRYHDPCRTGRVDRETLRATLKGAKLPLFRDLLDYMVDKFPIPEDDLCNRVDYCQFLAFLNWESNPAPVSKPAANTCVMRWVEPKPPLKLFCVNYRALLEDVCPNYKCALASVCCCCNENKPCPQHPQQQRVEPENFCPDNSNQETLLNACPQEPVTVVVPPCKVTFNEGNAHKCAPGALKCNLEDEQQPTFYDDACQQN